MTIGHLPGEYGEGVLPLTLDADFHWYHLYPEGCDGESVLPTCQISQPSTPRARATETGRDIHVHRGVQAGPLRAP